jgi:hypothetical protein
VAKEVKRKLTPFLCQELLYDYAIDALDPERKVAVEELLQTNSELKKSLETIHRGFWYSDQLSKLEPTDSLVGRLEQSENIVSITRKVTDYTTWPDWVKWSLVSILASACFALVVIVIPWSKFNFKRAQIDDKTVVLAPLNTEGESGENADADDGAPEHESSGDFDESGAPVEDVAGMTPPPVEEASPTPVKVASTPGMKIPPLEPLPKTANAVLPQVAMATPAPIVPAKPIVLSKPIVPAKPIATPVTAVAVAATPAPPAAAAVADADDFSGGTEKKDAKAKGFVYRAFMTIPNVEDISDQIVSQIKELGGIKAGEVELGWKRGPLRYFHFTMPQANEELLMEQLRAYGPVRISKDPHPRVMPEGQVRFILSIDAK